VVGRDTTPGYLLMLAAVLSFVIFNSPAAAPVRIGVLGGSLASALSGLAVLASVLRKTEPTITR
jgi:hypothetical protein